VKQENVTIFRIQGVISHNRIVQEMSSKWSRQVIFSYVMFVVSNNKKTKCNTPKHFTV